MKKILLLSSMILGASSLMAQNYKGLVLDSNDQPMPFANVVMMSLPDSAFICGTVSDIDGNFAVECTNKADLLRVTSVGYEPVFVNNPADNLGSIRMKASDAQIEEVVVKAQKPKTRLTGNSMVTSIAGSVLENSGTANEMLSKVPGLVDGANGLEVIGKGSPVIYINGRKLQDMDELKRINSSEIKEVEVITNPGAQYDASVTAVVKIKTIRRQGTGFGFDMEAADCYDIEYGENNKNSTLNLRYRHKNVDVFGTANYWDWTTINDMTPHTWTYFKANDDVRVLEQDAKMRTKWYGQSFVYNMGANWQISDNHSVGLRMERREKLDGYNSIDEQTIIKDFLMLAPNDINNSTSHSKQYSDDQEPYNMEGNAYYNGTVGKMGIDFNFDFLANKSNSNNVVQILEGISANTQNTTGDSKKTNMVASKLVVTYPIWQGQLTLGQENSFVKRSQDYLVSGLDIPSSQLEVREQNQAFFAEYGMMLQKIGSLSAGIRFEHVGLDYTSFSNPEGSISRNDNNVFPTAAWARQFGEFQTSLSYSFKVHRPNYWSLSDAMVYLNPYSYQQGDPKLKNENVQSLGANVHWKVFNLSASYECRKNSQVEWSYVHNNDGVIVIKQINLSEPVNMFAAFLNVAPTFGVYSPNWTVGMQTATLRKSLADPREATEEREIVYNKPISIFNCNNAFRLKGNWQLEANMNCQFKGDWITYNLSNNICNLNFVAQKSFLKDKSLVLRLTLQDALRKSGQRVELDCGYYTIVQQHHKNSQRLNVSLRYTFNQSQSKYKGTGAGNDAKGRM